MKNSAALEKQADEILRNAGSGSLCINHDFDWQTLEFSKDGYGGRTAPHYIYEPAKEAKAAATKTGAPCPGCGKPMSKWANKNSKCSACYHAKAIKKHSERVIYKEKRQEILADKHSAMEPIIGIGEAILVEGHNEWYFVRQCGDFAPELIREISAAENAIGVPAAFWGADISLLKLMPLVHEF